jgi:serine protease Do
MKWLKVLVVFIALGGIALVAILKAPAVYGQRDDVPDRRARELAMLSGRGSALGVTVRDVRPAEAGGDRTAGVLIDEVRPGSPADKAGLARGDIVVEFDGERVRSARQFSRLVQETAPGRAVKAVMLRDGARRNIEITLAGDADRRAELMIHGDLGDYMRDLGRDLGRLGDRLPPFNFNFDFDLPLAGRRLGVSVEELTSQLAAYFGAKDGVLVTSVADGSAASRAGLKAGDVITSINGQSVRSREDLLRGLREAPDSDEVTIAIVRDKKDSTVKAKIEAPRRTSRGRPV